MTSAGNFELYKPGGLLEIPRACLARPLGSPPTRHPDEGRGWKEKEEEEEGGGGTREPRDRPAGSRTPAADVPN